MKPSSMLQILAASLLAGCATVGDLFERERTIALAEIPAVVRTAAESAVPNLVLTEAEVATRRGVTTYEFVGAVGSKSYEIKVGADGKVLEVKEE